MIKPKRPDFILKVDDGNGPVDPLHLVVEIKGYRRIDAQNKRQAMETHKLTTDGMGMALRYGLMTALQVKAEKERELAAAEEADRLASSIAVQQFSYRDIRQRRDALKKLIGEIKRGDVA